MNRTFLHVGCGAQKTGLKGFASGEWREVRFDIDENVHPDIISTLTDMRAVETASIDAIFSSHNIEHLYDHEVPIALEGFHRVLKDDGFAVITCPDLESVCAAVVEGNLVDPLYVSPAGPISPIDILYGHRGFIASGNTYMTHKCGFTWKVLGAALADAGFTHRSGIRRPNAYYLWVIAFKAQQTEDKIAEAVSRFLP